MSGLGAFCGSTLGGFRQSKLGARGCVLPTSMLLSSDGSYDGLIQIPEAALPSDGSTVSLAWSDYSLPVALDTAGRLGGISGVGINNAGEYKLAGPSLSGQKPSMGVRLHAATGAQLWAWESIEEYPSDISHDIFKLTLFHDHATRKVELAYELLVTPTSSPFAPSRYTQLSPTGPAAVPYSSPITLLGDTWTWHHGKNRVGANRGGSSYTLAWSDERNRAVCLLRFPGQVFDWQTLQSANSGGGVNHADFRADLTGVWRANSSNLAYSTGLPIGVSPFVAMPGFAIQAINVIYLPLMDQVAVIGPTQLRLYDVSGPGAPALVDVVSMATDRRASRETGPGPVLTQAGDLLIPLGAVLSGHPFEATWPFDVIQCWRPTASGLVKRFEINFTGVPGVLATMSDFDANF